MTHFQDGTDYSYMPEFVDGSVNVGWLDGAEPFPTGEVPPEFADRLAELCGKAVNLTRGFHHCNLCPLPEEGQFPKPVTVPTPAGEAMLGHGEIRVSGTDGVTYAAPDLVIHYVTAHQYRPPQKFIDAVLAG